MKTVIKHDPHSQIVVPYHKYFRFGFSHRRRGGKCVYLFMKPPVYEDLSNRNSTQNGRENNILNVVCSPLMLLEATGKTFSWNMRMRAHFPFCRHQLHQNHSLQFRFQLRPARVYRILVTLPKFAIILLFFLVLGVLPLYSKQLVAMLWRHDRFDSSIPHTLIV